MLGKLFGKKTPPALSFVVDKDAEGNDKVSFEFTDAFKEFLRNSESTLDIANLPDDELAHAFMYQYSQAWLMENAKLPVFIETHSFPEQGAIRYDRAWNDPFVQAVAKLGFEVMPSTEEELADMYMNYVYGTRLLEELEAAAESEPTSVAHPQLSDPKNKFKG